MKSYLQKLFFFLAIFLISTCYADTTDQPVVQAKSSITKITKKTFQLLHAMYKRWYNHRRYVEIYAHSGFSLYLVDDNDVLGYFDASKKVVTTYLGKNKTGAVRLPYEQFIKIIAYFSAVPHLQPSVKKLIALRCILIVDRP